ncbi:MAG: hypothetical protein U0234_04635 [Sandaracinus sp.]
MRGGEKAKGLALALGLNAVVIGGAWAWAWIVAWRASGLAAVLGDSTGLLLLLVGVPATFVGLGWAFRSRLPGLAAGPPPASPPAPVAHAARGPSESMEALRAKLFVARVCSPTDLEANRAGRMSTRQRLRAVLHAALAALLAAATLGWAAHVLTDDAMRDRAGHVLPIGERLVGAGLYTLFGVALAVYALSRARVVRAPVVFVDGPAVAGVSYGARGAVLHHVDVGGHQLATHERTRGALHAGARYRAYHAAGAHELLSMEPLDEG